MQASNLIDMIFFGNDTTYKLSVKSIKLRCRDDGLYKRFVHFESLFKIQGVLK